MSKEWTIFNYFCDDDVIGSSSFDFGRDIFLQNNTNINICVFTKSCVSKSTCKIINSLTLSNYIDNDDKIDMTDPFTLYNFIKEGMNECPAKNYALFINCHSQGWFMKHYKYHQLTVTYNDLFKKIKENNIFFEFIVLCSCHTSTLELMYEFRNTTNYLIGCENPSPFFPFIYSENTINIIINNISTRDICVNIAKDYMYRINNPDSKTSKAYAPGEPDISVLDVKLSTELIETIIKFDMSKIRLKDLQYFRLVPDDIRFGQEAFVVYDLYTVISYYFSKDKNYENFINIFNKALVYYDQSNKFKKESTSVYANGIGYTPCPYEHHSRGISYIKMDIYKYHENLLSNCDILTYT